MTDGGANVESKTKGVSTSVTSVPQFTAFTVTPTSATPSASTVYTFSATAGSPLNDGDILSLDKQTEVTNPTSPVCRGVTNLETELIAFIDTTKIKIVLDFTGGTSLAAGTAFSFTCESFTNPATTSAPTGNFVVLVEEPGTGHDVVEFTGTLQVTAVAPTTIAAHTTDVYLSIASDEPGASTTYTFAAKTTQAIPAGGKICIEVPSDVTVDSATVSCTGGGVLSGSAACTYDGVSRCINVVGAAAAGDFTLAVANVANPTTGATPSFSFKTSNAGGTELETRSTGVTATIPCNSPCASCQSGSPDSCITCIGSQLKTGTTCAAACPSGETEVGGVCFTDNSSSGNSSNSSALSIVVDESTNWALSEDVNRGILGIMLLVSVGIMVTAVVLKLAKSQYSLLATAGMLFAWVETIAFIWFAVHTFLITKEAPLPDPVAYIAGAVVALTVGLNVLASVMICEKENKSNAGHALMTSVNFRLIRFQVASATKQSVFSANLKTLNNSRKIPATAPVMLIIYMISMAAISLPVILLTVGCLVGSPDWGDETAYAAIGMLVLESAIFVLTALEIFNSVPVKKATIKEPQVSIDFKDKTGAKINLGNLSELKQLHDDPSILPYSVSGNVLS